MSVDEGNHGIEVSLDASIVVECSAATPRPSKASAFLRGEQLRRRAKSYRAQYSTSAHQCAAPAKVHHRVPFVGYSVRPDAPYEHARGKLANFKVRDEFLAVRTELQKLKAEVDALERDKFEFDLKRGSIPAAPSDRQREWDLGRAIRAASPQDQLQLRRARGNCLSVQLRNPRARDALLTACRSSATHLQHLCMSGAGWFLSRDAEPSAGRLPDRLKRRLDRSERHPGDILYLSAGPRGNYYAEFRSGECWWGHAAGDDDFQLVVKTWDVYRVAFGPSLALEDHRGRQTVSDSWIVLGRDGRAAWKNLPSRLHHRLEGRIASWSAPAEVALGPGGSYFVRFLDGTLDYCLPASMADACEKIERNGGKITNIAMNPETSHDFIIRHTELK